MPDVRRCSIYGCRSNSREHKELKFFNFPTRDSPFYDMWLAQCEESAEIISTQRRPYICSKHFHKKDVGFRRLAAGALPALFLTAPPGFVEEERARQAMVAAEQEKKVLMINLVNDTVLEWVRRAKTYVDTAETCQTRRELRRTADRVRNLLGATLYLQVDDYWLRKFRCSHINQLLKEDPKAGRNKSLDLEEIIAELAPSAKILNEDEITALLKEERARLNEIEKKRSLARQKKRATSDFSLVVGVHRKKYKALGKKAAFSDNSYADYSGQSSDYFRDDSVSDDCYEVKSERNDSIDISQSDDDDADDMEESFKEPEQSVKNEIVIDSYQQALEHLKPLEDFALREENFRAIGLLTTLEIIFKNPKRALEP